MRFCEFNDLYQEIQFKNAFKLLRGSSPRPIIEYITNHINDPYWIKIGDMPEYDFIVNCVKEHISLEGAKHSRAVYKGDMILSNSMSYGKPYILNIDGYIHDGWFVIRKYSDHFNRDYLMYILSSPCVQKRYSQIAAGGVVQNISSDLVNSVKVKIPNKEEQIKVADFLNKIDARILTQKKIIEKYESLIKTISFIVIKKNGDVYKVKDICNIGRGRVISNVEINKQSNPMYPVFSSQTQNNGIMGYLDNYEFDGEYITWTTDGANAGTIFYHNEKFNCTNVCGTLKVFNDNISTKYLSVILPYYVKKYVSKNLANPKLMNNTMANIEVKVVPFNEQLKIVNIVSSLENKLNNEKSILQLYIKQKEYLLNKLFI